MNLFRTNVAVKLVERPTSLDRYGEPQQQVLKVHFEARLDRRRGMSRTPEGDFVQTDGTLWLEASCDVRPEDVVTLDSPAEERFRVFSSNEQSDVQGQVKFRTCVVVQQR